MVIGTIRLIDCNWSQARKLDFSSFPRTAWERCPGRSSVIYLPQTRQAFIVGGTGITPMLRQVHITAFNRVGVDVIQLQSHQASTSSARTEYQYRHVRLPARTGTRGPVYARLWRNAGVAASARLFAAGGGR